MILKVRREDGKIAVLTSPDYGAGWSTWASSAGDIRERMIFSPTLVRAIIEKNLEGPKLIALAKKEFPDECCEGAGQLQIIWLEEGTKFRIEEHHGAERLVTESAAGWYQA